MRNRLAEKVFDKDLRIIRINIICPTKPIARKITLISHSTVNVVVFVGASFFLNTFKQKSKFFPSTYLHVSVNVLNLPPPGRA